MQLIAAGGAGERVGRERMAELFGHLEASDVVNDRGKLDTVRAIVASLTGHYCTTHAEAEAALLGSDD